MSITSGPMTGSDAVVIGAGIAGLASAIRLHTLGNRVTILEASDVPGGKNREIKKAGFRWDAGPSVFTLPELLEETLAAAGLNPSKFISYEALPSSCDYFWTDGTKLTAWTDPHRFISEASAVTGEPAENIHRYLMQGSDVYSLTSNLFLNKSLHRLSSYLTRDAFKALLNLPKLETGITLAKSVEKRINHPKLRQLFNRYATYNGSDPFRAPGTLSVISHLEHERGAYFPSGGTISISRSLVKAIEKLGISIHLNSRAERILHQNGAVTGVQVQGKIYPAKVVVSNMDIHNSYHHLLPDLQSPAKTLSQEKSSSALIFYWGLKGNVGDLGLHNILFSDDYPAEFRSIFSDKKIPADPTVYIYISSKKIPTDAPEGHENWFVMINVPANSGQEWDSMIQTARQSVINRINRQFNIDISDRIVAESVLDPRTIESLTFSYQGALYGNSSNNRMAAFLRHKNFHSDIRGLYFAGGSVHPGGGVPLCLLSAKIVSDLVAHDQSSS